MRGPVFRFLLLSAASSAISLEMGPVATSQETQRMATEMRENMTGAYGPWLADRVLGNGPARLSFRTGNWKSLDAWRSAARKRVWECMAAVDLGGSPAGAGRIATRI